MNPHGTMGIRDGHLYGDGDTTGTFPGWWKSGMDISKGMEMLHKAPWDGVDWAQHL